MTPKEKADELIKKMQLNDDWGEIDRGQASEHAIILVDEILWEAIKYADTSKEYVRQNSEFWHAVRKELESF